MKKCLGFLRERIPPLKFSIAGILYIFSTKLKTHAKKIKIIVRIFSFYVMLLLINIGV